MNSTANIIYLNDEEIRRAQDDWNAIGKEDAHRRKRWLHIGAVLVKGRAQYPANQAYGEWARAIFPGILKQVRSAAVWWASLDQETRAFCEKMWPEVTHPVRIRPLLTAHERAVAEEEDEDEEAPELPEPLANRFANGASLPVESEIVENPEPLPEIPPVEAVEKSEKSSRGMKVPPNNPLRVHGLKEEDVQTLLGFYPNSTPRKVIYDLARAGSGQKKFLIDLAGLIRSGNIGEVNLLPQGISESYRNAKIISHHLPKMFADQWAFGNGKIPVLKRLLEDAPRLWQIGEAIKEYPPFQKGRITQAYRLWEDMNRKPGTALAPMAAPAPLPSATPSTQDETPPEHQQAIKICGRTFWPQTEYQSPLLYRQVWGAALYVESLYNWSVIGHHDAPEAAMVHLMQFARSWRLMDVNCGNLLHEMASAIRDHPEWVNDPVHSSWPKHSRQPVEYQK